MILSSKHLAGTSTHPRLPKSTCPREPKPTYPREPMPTCQREPKTHLIKIFTRRNRKVVRRRRQENLLYFVLSPVRTFLRHFGARSNLTEVKK